MVAQTNKRLLLGILIPLFGVMLFNNNISSADPIKIAAIFSKTGIAASDDKPFLQMADLVKEEINRHGGILDNPVELIVLDTHSTPIGASIAAEEAIKSNVVACIGASWSSHSLAMAPILQKAKIPMISPSSTHPKVTHIGDYIFRVCFVDSFQGKVMASFAYSDLEARTAVILRLIDQEYSLALADFFSQFFTAKGGSVLWVGGYKSKAIDVKEMLTKTKDLKPDVVFLPGYSRDSGLIIQQARSMDIRSIFLGTDGWNQIHKYGDDSVNGNFYSNQWHRDIPHPKSIQLHKKYKQIYGYDLINPNAVLVYDAFMILADAITRAETINREKVRETLCRTKDYKGITGQITFNEEGDPIEKPAVIVKLMDGNATYIKTMRP